MFRTRIIAITVAATLIAGISGASALPAKRNTALPQLPVMIGTGETVSVTAGKWNQKVTLSYQWLLNGVPIKKATKTSYLVQAGDLGKKLSVVENAKFSDGKILFANSDSRTVGQLVVSGSATITKDQVNSKLLLSAPDITKTGLTKRINWYASGSRVEGENLAELVVDKRFESLGVYSKVTYTATGYTPLVLKTNTINFAAPQVTDNTLLWSDEFNSEVGSGPNLNDWNDVTGNGTGGWGNLERQYYLPGASLVSNMDGATDSKGLLITATNQTTNPHPNGPYDCWYTLDWRGKRTGPSCEWVSGKITTENKLGFLYGHLEARIKTTGAGGTWPAFWMLGQDFKKVGWPGCGEIDIHEGNGGLPNSNWGTIHGYNYWPGGQVTQQTSMLAGWHVYGLDWKPDYIAFSVDGQIYKTIRAADLTVTPWNLNLETNAWEFNKPQFAILNLAVGGRIIGGGNLPVKTTDINKDTKSMQIDYIRYSTLDGYGTLIRY